MCLSRQKPFVQINHSAELTVWRINYSWLYTSFSLEAEFGGT